MTVKKIFSILSIVLLLMYATAVVVYPQTPSNSRISGTVHGVTSDLVGALVPKVVLLFESGESRREVTSDEVGRFQIELPAGIYRVTVKKFGILDPFQRKNVKVQAGRRKELHIVLTYDPKKYPPVI